MNAPTSSLAFEMLEGEGQGLKVLQRLTFGSTFSSKRFKAASLGNEDVFLTDDSMPTDEVVCIKGKMTVSF